MAKRRKSRLTERRASRPTVIDPAQAYSVAEVCSALDISRAGFYVLLAKGAIKLLELDGRPRVTGAEIQRITGGAQAA